MFNFNAEWAFRIILSALLGGFIGYERHNRSKEAGVRTHAIVALAACLMMLISKYGFSDTPGADPARIAAQVIPGIGFLGAGIIFVRNDTIQGLTTAAGIWATAGIGLAVGAGMYFIGVLSAILIVTIEALLHSRFYFGGMRTSIRLEVEILKECHAETDILTALEKQHLTMSDMQYAKSKNDKAWILLIDAATQHELNPDLIIDSIQKITGVIKVSVSSPE